MLVSRKKWAISTFSETSGNQHRTRKALHPDNYCADKELYAEKVCRYHRQNLQNDKDFFGPVRKHCGQGPTIGAFLGLGGTDRYQPVSNR